MQMDYISHNHSEFVLGPSSGRAHKLNRLDCLHICVVDVVAVTIFLCLKRHVERAGPKIPAMVNSILEKEKGKFDAY